MTASGAALCNVHVSSDVLEKDIVTALLLKRVQLQTHQVTVRTVKSKKNELSMTVSHASSHTMTQRNAILRSLVGAALHGALDNNNNNSSSSSHHPHLYLAGGTFAAASSAHGTSLQASVNAASLTQWMSVADDLRNKKSKLDIETLLTGLNELLQESAYLLPYSATCSLADLDLAVALLSLKPQPEYPANVARWLHQVTVVLQQLAHETGVGLDNLQLPPSPAATAAAVPPIFFYGTENTDKVLDALYSTSSDTTKKKQQQQQQQRGKADEKQQQQQQKSQGEANKKKEKAGKKGGGGDQAPTTYDVTALDIRVGKIVKVWPHESAEKLFCEEIDIGNGEIRQIASGLRPFYKEADLQDRVVLVLCNLKKRNLVGFPSHGMVLCASNADHSSVEFVVPPEGSILGERVVFDRLNADAEPEPENKVGKKKIFEQIAPDLKTDADGNVIWKGHAAKTSAGAVRALNKMANASVS